MTAGGARARLMAARCAGYGHDRWRGVAEGIALDIQRFLNKSPENQAAGNTLKSRTGALLTHQLLALLLFRVSHWLWLRRWTRLAECVSRMNYLLHKVNLPPQTCLGPGCLLPHPATVTFIGSAGAGLTFYAGAVCWPGTPVTHSLLESSPYLGDNVTVGAHAVLVGPISVGDRTKIAYKVIVDSNLPSDVIAAGLSMKTRII